MKSAESGSARVVGLVVVALCLVGAILLLWRSDAAAPSVATTPDVGADSAAAQALEVPPKQAETSNDPSRELPLERSSVAETANAAALVRTVQGTLRFREEGANAVTGGGAVVLSLEQSGTSREVSALHKDGVFSFPAVEGERECTVVSISIGRLEARATTARHTISADGALGIEIEWSPGTLLHVVDAATGAELVDVTLVVLGEAGLRSPLGSPRVPSASERGAPLLRGQRSPFPLPRATSVETCWAHAPGYAWAPAFFEGGEGERRIELQRESALELRVTWDLNSKRSVFLKLQDPRNGALLLRARLESGAPRARFDALPPGQWSAQLVHSIKGRDVVLARSVLELRPGETTPWNVASLAEGERSTGGIEVSVLVPADAASRPWAQLVGPLPSDPDSEPVAVGLERNETTGEWSAAFRGLTPGDYELRVATWNVTRAVSVFESQVTPVRIELAGLALLVVNVVDIEGKPLEAARVLYEPVSDGGLRYEVVSAQRDAVKGRWTALVQPGALNVIASAPQLASAVKRVVVGAAGAEIVLTLATAADIPLRLTVRSGAALVPAPLDDWPKVSIEAVTGWGQLARLEFGGRAAAAASAEVLAIVTAPGRYKVTLPRGFGGSTSERSFEVDVVTDGGGELDLQLDG